MQKLQDDEWLHLFEEYEKFDGAAKDFFKANDINDKTFYSGVERCLELTKNLIKWRNKFLCGF